MQAFEKETAEEQIEFSFESIGEVNFSEYFSI